MNRLQMPHGLDTGTKVASKNTIFLLRIGYPLAAARDTHPQLSGAFARPFLTSHERPAKRQRFNVGAKVTVRALRLLQPPCARLKNEEAARDADFWLSTASDTKHSGWHICGRLRSQGRVNLYVGSRLAAHPPNYLYTRKSWRNHEATRFSCQSKNNFRQTCVAPVSNGIYLKRLQQNRQHD